MSYESSIHISFNPVLDALEIADAIIRKMLDEHAQKGPNSFLTNPAPGSYYELVTNRDNLRAQCTHFGHSGQTLYEAVGGKMVCRACYSEFTWFAPAGFTWQPGVIASGSIIVTNSPGVQGCGTGIGTGVGVCGSYSQHGYGIAGC